MAAVLPVAFSSSAYHLLASHLERVLAVLPNLQNKNYKHNYGICAFTAKGIKDDNVLWLNQIIGASLSYAQSLNLINHSFQKFSCSKFLRWN